MTFYIPVESFHPMECKNWRLPRPRRILTKLRTKTCNEGSAVISPLHLRREVCGPWLGTLDVPSIICSTCGGMRLRDDGTVWNCDGPDIAYFRLSISDSGDEGSGGIPEALMSDVFW